MLNRSKQYSNLTYIDKEKCPMPSSRQSSTTRISTWSIIIFEVCCVVDMLVKMAHQRFFYHLLLKTEMETSNYWWNISTHYTTWWLQICFIIIHLPWVWRKMGKQRISTTHACGKSSSLLFKVTSQCILVHSTYLHKLTYIFTEELTFRNYQLHYNWS